MTTPNPTPMAAVEDAITPIKCLDRIDHNLEKYGRYAGGFVSDNDIETIRKAITHPQHQSAGF